MPQLAEQALDKTCNADRYTREPWIALTRHDTAVTQNGKAILHGWREPFNLWESVQYQAYRRRHMEGAAS